MTRHMILGICVFLSASIFARMSEETVLISEHIEKRKLKPLVFSEAYIARKEIPFDTCELRDPAIHIGGVIVGGTPQKSGFIYCYSAEKSIAVLIPAITRMLDFGLVLNVAYQSTPYPRFVSESLDGKRVSDIFGDYSGVTSGLAFFYGGLIGIYSKSDIVIKNTGAGGGFGFEVAFSVYKVAPRNVSSKYIHEESQLAHLAHYDDKEDFPGISYYLLQAIAAKKDGKIDAHKLLTFDPEEFKEWRFKFNSDKLDPIPAP